MAVLLRSWRDEKEKKRLKRKTLRGLRSGERHKTMRHKTQEEDEEEEGRA
jgi:hypothetical protein